MMSWRGDNGRMAGPFCSGCSERLRRGAKFCDRCGRPVDASQGVLRGEMYRSTSLVVGQQRIIGALGMTMMGILMILVGAVIPAPEGFMGDGARAFKSIATIMGLVVLAFSAVIYFASKKHAEQQ